MTRAELIDRILALFPPLAEVEPWQWAETDDGEPVVCIEGHATFTGLDTGDVDLTAPVPETSMIGVWRIDPSGHYDLVGLGDDPLVKAAAEQAKTTSRAAAPQPQSAQQDLDSASRTYFAAPASEQQDHGPDGHDDHEDHEFREFTRPKEHLLASRSPAPPTPSENPSAHERVDQEEPRQDVDRDQD